ncbi:MAG: hypothetical protein QXH96_00150 [Candidatus Geothermarchaeota archaeon]
MPKIEAYCTLEELRRFLLISTSKDKVAQKYIKDPSFFIERRGEKGRIYIEAGNKVDVEKVNDVVIVKVEDVYAVQYTSKSGRTRLIWSQVYKDLGKLVGVASGNTLVNLLSCGIRDIKIIKEGS